MRPPSHQTVSASAVDAAQSASIYRMLGGACPRCSQELKTHSYKMFASEIATAENKEVLTRFFDLAKNHQWKDLLGHQSFDGSKNAAQILALTCPNTALSMLYVRDPAELWDPPTLEAHESLNDTDAILWKSFLGVKGWIEFKGGPRET